MWSMLSLRSLSSLSLPSFSSSSFAVGKRDYAIMSRYTINMTEEGKKRQKMFTVPKRYRKEVKEMFQRGEHQPYSQIGLSLRQPPQSDLPFSARKKLSPPPSLSPPSLSSSPLSPPPLPLSSASPSPLLPPPSPNPFAHPPLFDDSNEEKERMRKGVREIGQERKEKAEEEKALREREGEKEGEKESEKKNVLSEEKLKRISRLLSSNQTSLDDDEDEPIKQPRHPHSLRVAFLGCPNSGKSTLLNRLLGRSISSVSSKAHTTREIFTLVKSHDKVQLVLIDTPGVGYIDVVRTRREFTMSAFVALKDADAIVLVIDIAKPLQLILGRDVLFHVNQVLKVRDNILSVTQKAKEKKKKGSKMDGEMERALQSLLSEVDKGEEGGEMWEDEEEDEREKLDLKSQFLHSSPSLSSSSSSSLSRYKNFLGAKEDNKGDNEEEESEEEEEEGEERKEIEEGEEEEEEEGEEGEEGVEEGNDLKSDLLTSLLIRETLKNPPPSDSLTEEERKKMLEEFMRETEKQQIEQTRNVKLPIIVCLNKVDLITRGDREAVILPIAKKLQEILNPVAIFAISGKHGKNVSLLEEYLSQRSLPRAWEYSSENDTDLSLKQRVEHAVRGELYHFTNNEVPYTVIQENVTSVLNQSGELFIHQNLWVTKSSRKKIIVGKNGEVIQKIQKRAEEKLSATLGVPVKLVLSVRIGEKSEILDRLEHTPQ